MSEAKGRCWRGGPGSAELGGGIAAGGAGNCRGTAELGACWGGTELVQWAELPGEGAGIAEGGCWWAVLVDLVKGMEPHREAVLVLDNLLLYI